MFPGMNVVLRYRGRDVTEADVEEIRRLSLEHAGKSRRGLSKVLCAAWHWVQPNGHPCDMVCRGMMLELHRAGWILTSTGSAGPAKQRRRAPAASADRGRHDRTRDDP